MNKVEFPEKTVFFLVISETYLVMCMFIYYWDVYLKDREKADGSILLQL